MTTTDTPGRKSRAGTAGGGTYAVLTTIETTRRTEDAVRQDSYERSVRTCLTAAPDDASATGRTYDDITKVAAAASPVRGLASFLSATRPPVHRRVTTAFFVADVPGLRRVQAVLFARLSLGCLVLYV